MPRGEQVHVLKSHDESLFYFSLLMFVVVLTFVIMVMPHVVAEFVVAREP